MVILHTASQKTYKYLSTWDPLNSEAVIPPIQVVTCFLQKQDKFLVLQRARKDQQHKLWGIPGGKLNKDELPLAGLVRECYEELKVSFLPEIFQLLGTALSNTPSDGQYGLYLYYASIANNLDIHINPTEHYTFRWVTIDEFQELSLLTAQREAFLLVKEKLIPML
jgi:8-oxo-dGTP diphosphatase